MQRVTGAADLITLVVEIQAFSGSEPRLPLHYLQIWEGGWWGGEIGRIVMVTAGTRRRGVFFVCVLIGNMHCVV